MPSRLLRQYAAIFFFAPLVQQRIKSHEFGLSDDDKSAIRHSVRRGYVTLGVGLGFLVVSVLSMIYDRLILAYLHGGLIIMTLLSVIRGVWQIHHSKNTHTNPDTVLVTHHMLVAFVPGYNRYLRYTQEDPQHPYWRLKESLLWRYVIMMCLLIPPLGSLGMMILALMVIRVIILAAGYDLIPVRVKSRLNRRYVLHVDELRSYANGYISSLRSNKDHATLIHEHKLGYRTPLPSSLTQRSFTTIISYVLLILGVVMLIWQGWQIWIYSINIPLVFWGCILLIAYYLIRRYTVGLGSVPLIQPIIEQLTHRFGHRNT